MATSGLSPTEPTKEAPIIMLHVGLDLSRRRADCDLLWQDGSCLERGALPPETLDGLRGLVARLGCVAICAVESMNVRAVQIACACPPVPTIICIPLRWLGPTERIPGGQTSVGAMPRSYQVTPVILGGGGRHGKSRSDQGRQAKRESARRRPRDKPTSRTTPDRQDQVLTEARSGCRPWFDVRRWQRGRGA